MRERMGDVQELRLTVRTSTERAQTLGLTRTRFNGRMAVSAATWADLLEGEEAAHVQQVPAAGSHTAPLPDDLHPSLREALPFPSSMCTSASRSTPRHAASI